MVQLKAEELVKLAAREAIKEYGKELKKIKKIRIFQNTKKLMENYTRIRKSIEEGVADLNEMEDAGELGELTEEDIFINSIIRSRLRSVIMLAHVDKCLKLLEKEEKEKNTYEKYLAFTYFYLDGITYEDISEELHCTDRTARRWVGEMTSILSVYLFGSDSLMME